MSRTLAIGDIHGCFNALQTLTEFAKIDGDDLVITLGDYVNRGPNSCAVLDWLIHHHSLGHLIPLRGNHEIMMLEARKDTKSMKRFVDVGGDTTLRSYSPFDDVGSLVDIPDGHWTFLETELFASHETENHFFVHANAYAEVPIDDQPEYMLYWEFFDDPPRHESGKIMICGHSSQKSGLPKSNGNAVCIDTWACGTGWLTCLDVNSGQLWQANESAETRRLFLDDL